ncbi:C40 family peptidase [Neobacillus niacini]|uniref:C40 family peptidase n=1 Tax=Neobacillus niacini TaxID=86668 RepID=UPI0021CB1C77|nr:C40 family peptidase [Neobacillus niacini]MCM3767594.1 C40 family peptidase [Neobacillus niacini]
MLKKFIIAFTILASCGTLFAAKGDKAEAAYYHTKAISVAKANLGVPYKWGGISPSGFDCSGLVKYSFGKAGITLNRTAAQMYYGNGYRPSNLEIGDLLFYAPNKASAPTHVAIYMGYGKMIMASSSKGVIVTKTSNPYWHARYIGAKRI